MIRAPFDRPDVLAKLRPVYLAKKSIVLPGACDPSALRLPRLKRFYVANRGRYEVAELRPRKELQAFAEALTGSRLDPVSLRLYRFRHRDYSLFYDDAVTRIERGVELSLDLSREAAGTPAIYSTGLVVPQVPGLLAVVERTPEVFRYDRYLPAAVGRASVLRLRAQFLHAD